MAEVKNTTPDRQPDRQHLSSEKTPTKRADLAPAGASGNPDVHKLLAERDAHVRNAGLDLDPKVEEDRRAEAQKRIDEVDEKLAELGYTAK